MATEEYRGPLAFHVRTQKPFDLTSSPDNSEVGFAQMLDIEREAGAIYEFISIRRRNSGTDALET